jgi:hypothetical protein
VVSVWYDTLTWTLIQLSDLLIFCTCQIALVCQNLTMAQVFNLAKSYDSFQVTL